jgi:hypothetical protein
MIVLNDVDATVHEINNLADQAPAVQQRLIDWLGDAIPRNFSSYAHASVAAMEELGLDIFFSNDADSILDSDEDYVRNEEIV